MHNTLWTEHVGPDPTSPQFALLAAIAAWPGLDQRQAGELASLDKSSTMDIVRRLSRTHWITRESNPRDARRDVLALTTVATLALDSLTPRVQRVQERLLVALPERVRADFLADLRTVARLGGDADPDSPQQIPGHLVRRAQQVHTALFAAEFEHTLTGPQFAVLHALAAHPSISQGELADRAALNKSTAAEIIDRMARRRWIERHRDPHDGRRHVLVLTTDGRSATVGLESRVARIHEQLLAPLEESRRGAFLDNLTVIAVTPPA